MNRVRDQPVGVVVRDFALGTRGLGFGSRSDQIGHSVVNGLPPLQCFFVAALLRRYAAEMDPATPYALRRNTATMINVCE